MAVSKSLAKPYARALFELASTEAQREQWLDRLQALHTVFQDAEVARAVQRVSTEQAVEWVKSSLGKQADDATLALVAQLLENGRIGSLGDIAEHFAALTREARGTGVLHVTTAVALTEKEKAEALKTFESLFKQKLIPQYHVDALIQGGVVGQVNDLVYDGSLKGSLEKLRENLIR